MFERYTEPARRVIFFARYEASQLGSSYLETEHLLLGLLRQDKQLVRRFLQSAAAVAAIRKRIEGHTTVMEKISTSVDLPLSLQTKRVLAYASEEAERLNQRHVGTEHFLLGLLREDNCLAAEILRERGLSLSSVRQELRTSPVPDGDEIHSVAPVFTLTVAEPKLKKADPSNVPGFHEGPGTEGKDPRIANPSARRLVTCQNMTMARFAESLPKIAPGYILGGTVHDATGLEGAWDFTLNFSPAGMEYSGRARASEAESAISLFDALEQQLGLRLQRTQIPAPPTSKDLPFRFAAILLRAAVLARNAGASEIGIDMLLLAMDSDPGSGLSDIDALLATFANGQSPGSFDASVILELSGEVQGILASFDKHMTTEALRRALIFARSNRTDTGDEA